MVTKTTKPKTTSMTLGGWAYAVEKPSLRVSTETRSLDKDYVVLLPARQKHDFPGGEVLIVKIDPASVERKLFIRELNNSIEGKTVRSNTLFKRRSS